MIFARLLLNNSFPRKFGSLFQFYRDWWIVGLSSILNPRFSARLPLSSILDPRFSIVLCLLWGILICACQRKPDPHVVVMALETSPTTLDPRIGTSEVTSHVYELIFNSLIRRDQNFQFAPDLALSWENPDPLTYVFHLRRGVLFHNGKELTSEDVKFTLDSLSKLTTPKKGSFSKLKEVTAPDRYTVVFHLSSPYLEFLTNLVRPAIGIVPAGSGADFFQHPVGTGPYRLIEFQQDRDVRLAAFDKYFEGQPALSEIYFRIIPDDTTRALELEKGSVDVALNSISGDMLLRLKKQAHLQVDNAPGVRYQYLAFNLKHPILSNVRVRQAIAYAIDRDSIIRYLYRGYARKASSILPPFHWAYEPKVMQYRYDPALARQLLDQAGYSDPDGDGPRTRFALDYKASTTAEFVHQAEIIQENLRRVGINVQIHTLELATVLSDVRRGSFELYSLRWVGANLFTDIFNFVFHSKSAPPAGANRGRYANPQVDALLDEANQTSDLGRRKEIFSQVQKIVAEDLPYVSLWYPDNVVVYNRRLENVRIIPSGDYVFLKDVRIRPK
ncbi:MAG TPA: ABC transporter substrate-binding protein [Acidobacteriota bacterium]|jgi:peptide/nickel transport system substrate-binding protein